MTITTKPLRVMYDVLVEDMKDATRNCPDCFFHFEDGTVTLCEEHGTQTVMDVFNRL